MSSARLGGLAGSARDLHADLLSKALVGYVVSRLARMSVHDDKINELKRCERSLLASSRQLARDPAVYIARIGLTVPFCGRARGPTL